MGKYRTNTHTIVVSLPNSIHEVSSPTRTLRNKFWLWKFTKFIFIIVSTLKILRNQHTNRTTWMSSDVGNSSEHKQMHKLRASLSVIAPQCFTMFHKRTSTSSNTKSLCCVAGAGAGVVYFNYETCQIFLHSKHVYIILSAASPMLDEMNVFDCKCINWDGVTSTGVA